jgi:ABC-2 type transport system permease protein
VLTVLYGWPVAASFIGDPEWYERIQQVGPTTAGMAIQATTGLADLPIGPWPGLGVLALYAGGALLLGGLLLRARDV